MMRASIINNNLIEGEVYSSSFFMRNFFTEKELRELGTLHVRCIDKWSRMYWFWALDVIKLTKNTVCVEVRRGSNYVIFPDEWERLVRRTQVMLTFQKRLKPTQYRIYVYDVPGRFGVVVGDQRIHKETVKRHLEEFFATLKQDMPDRPPDAIYYWKFSDQSPKSFI